MEDKREDRLEQVLNRVIDWVKYEEAKNAALITLDSVGVGVILQWPSASQSSTALSPWLKNSSLAAILISLLIALSSVYPVLNGNKLRDYVVSRWRRRLEKKTAWEPNVLFFGDIAGLKAEEYLKHFHRTIDAGDGNTNLELAYAQQITANADIALMKVRIFQAAFLLSFLGFIIMTCGAAIAHLR